MKYLYFITKNKAPIKGKGIDLIKGSIKPLNENIPCITEHTISFLKNSPGIKIRKQILNNISSLSDVVIVRVIFELQFFGQIKWFASEFEYSLRDYLRILSKTNNFTIPRESAFNKLLVFIKKLNKENKTELLKMSKRWDCRAKTWDMELVDSNSYVNFEDGYKRFTDLLKKLLPFASKSALDIGCGTGEITKIIANNKKLKVKGIDISKKMIVMAKNNFSNENLIFESSNITELVNKKEKYDFIASRGILISHIPITDVYDYLYEVSLLAKPNAYFVFDFLQSSSKLRSSKDINKNTFKISQISNMMSHLGWKIVCANGLHSNKVISVAYCKTRKDISGVYMQKKNQFASSTEYI